MQKIELLAKNGQQLEVAPPLANLDELPKPVVPSFKYDPYSVVIPAEFQAPYRVNFETNEICNMGCGFCFADYHEGVRAYEAMGIAAPGMLQTEEVAAMIYQAAQLAPYGTRQILFGGGDPFIRQDTPELIEYAYAAGLHVVVDTNGLILPKRPGLYDRIAPLIHQLGLSLDGSTPEAHNSFRETTPHSFARVLELMDRSRGYAHKLKVNTIVTAANMHDIPDMVDLLAEYGDVLDRWSLDQFIPVNRGKENEARYRITDEQYLAVMQEVRRRAEGKLKPEVFGGALKSQKVGTVMMFGPQGIPYVMDGDEKRHIPKSIRTRPLHRLVTMATEHTLNLQAMNGARYSSEYYQQ